MTQITSLDDIKVGDTLLVIPNHGRRFAVLIDWISGGIASGRQAQIHNPMVLHPTARKIVIAGDFRRAKFERMG